MAQSDPLAQLRDIHLPDPVGWWPMAPGWWMLIAISIAVLTVLLWWLWRRIVAARAKKEALRLLKLYEQQSLEEMNSARICARVSELLRRVALAYFPREHVAALHGQEWIDFLNKHSRNINFTAVQNLLLERAYQAQSQDNLKPLFTRARRWIQQRRLR